MTYQDFKEAWANEMGRLCDELPDDIDDIKRMAFDEIMKPKQGAEPAKQEKNERDKIQGLGY